MFRNHEHVLKPRWPLISDSLSIAARLPVTIMASIVKQPDDDADEFFDAPDHFSDDEFDEFDDEQAPEDDISEMVVKFHQLPVWNNSEDNLVEYVLPPNFGNFPNFPKLPSKLLKLSPQNSRRRCRLGRSLS